MRVLHINDYSPDDRAGGAEVLMQRTVALLRLSGVEAQVFTVGDVPNHKRTAVSYIDNRPARKALRATLEALHPAVVHLHNFYHELSPGILAELARWRRRHALRVVVTAHDFHLICPNSGLSHFARGERRQADAARLDSMRYLISRRWDHRGLTHSSLKLIQHLYSYRFPGRRSRALIIDALICPSAYAQSLLESLGVPTVLVPHPIDPPLVPAPPRAPGLQFVFAGRIEPEKGLAEFLENVPDEFPARLLVLGEGSDRARCQSIAAARGFARSLDFRGQLPHHEARRAIASSHVLILPSLVAENCPMSLLEALAAGTNILTSNRGGMREIVERAGVGFRHDPGNAPSLAAALDAILSAHRDRTLNRFEAREFLCERTEQAYVSRLMEVYGGGASSEF